MGNKSSTTTSPKGGFTKQKDPEVPHNTKVEKQPAVRRNSATTTVASSTTSASTSRTNSPPALGFDVPVLRVSQKQRPRGVADMEIKSHCEKIKRIVGTSRLSQKEDLTITPSVISSNDESVIYECFGCIVAIAQNSPPLEKSTLDDYLITCHSIRKNQPKCANNVTLLMSQAKALIEALVVPVNNGTTPGTSAIQPPLIIGLSPNDGNVNGNDGMALSQHGKITITSDLLQEMRQQYALARAACTEPVEVSSGLPAATTLMGVNDTVLPVPVVRSGPPPIQVTTVRTGPPPIQVTTIRAGPPPIQVTTVNLGSLLFDLKTIDESSAGSPITTGSPPALQDKKKCLR